MWMEIVIRVTRQCGVHCCFLGVGLLSLAQPLTQHAAAYLLLQRVLAVCCILVQGATHRDWLLLYYNRHSTQLHLLSTFFSALITQHGV